MAASELRREGRRVGTSERERERERLLRVASLYCARVKARRLGANRFGSVQRTAAAAGRRTRRKPASADGDGATSCFRRVRRLPERSSKLKRQLIKEERRAPPSDCAATFPPFWRNGPTATRDGTCETAARPNETSLQVDKSATRRLRLEPEAHTLSTSSQRKQKTRSEAARLAVEYHFWRAVV